MPHHPRTLTGEQVGEFYAKGFLVLPGFATRREVTDILGETSRVREQAERLADRIDPSIPGRTEIDGDGGKYVFSAIGGKVYLTRALWCPALAPVTLGFSRGQVIRKALDDLFYGVEHQGERAVEHLASQFHYKLPGGGKYPLHQDSSPRRYGDEACWVDVDGRGSYIQTILALDPMTIENGPLVVYPGNPGRHLGVPYKEFEETPRDGLSLPDAVPVFAKPGDVVFLHPFTWHESDVNRSKRPRRAFVNGYGFPGANRRPFTIPGAGERFKLDGLTS